MLTRRFFLSAATGTSTLALLPGTWKAAWAEVDPLLLERKGDHVLGKTDAPITIVEYASFTCLHCAAFVLNLQPRIQKEWIDLGKAKLIYRDFPLDRMAYEAALLARAIPGERYFAFVQALFAQQEKWLKAKEPRLVLIQLAKLAGLSEAGIAAAFANQVIGDVILAQVMEASEKLQVQATPSLFVNGKKADHRTYESFSAALKAAL